jgi:hypothetical protein
MVVHRVSGLYLGADIPLPELPRAPAVSTADFRFRLLAARRRLAAPRVWLHRWREEDGSGRISLGRTGRGYLVRFAGVADFLLSRDAGTILCRARPRVSALTVRHLLLDQIIPMVLGHRGHLALHASAAFTGKGALAFAGKAGWGKSTLCASLARAGLPVVADDCVAVEERRGRFVAIPSYPGLRLWPNAARALWRGQVTGLPVADYSDKRRLDPQRRAARGPGATPLLAVYVLTPPSRSKSVRISRLAPREAVGRLLAHTHRLDVTDRARLTVELDALGRLAERVPVFELHFPRDLGRLSALRTAVLRHAAAEL